MCQKSLAEFAARRRQRNEIIFSRDMCVRENTARAASVEFVRHRRTNYARSRPQTFCRKNPEGFSTVLEGVPKKFPVRPPEERKDSSVFLCARFLQPRQAAAADVLAQDSAKILASAAKNAALFVLLQNDGAAVYINFQRVLLCDAECAAKLGGKHDPPKLVNFSYDPGCFHSGIPLFPFLLP